MYSSWGEKNKYQSRESETKPQTGRKYLQKIHLIIDCHRELERPLKAKNKKTNLIKNGPNTLQGATSKTT